MKPRFTRMADMFYQVVKNYDFPHLSRTCFRGLESLNSSEEGYMKSTNRQVWFKARIDDLLSSISNANKKQEWEEYKNLVHELAHELASELLYVCTEWDKYYISLNEVNMISMDPLDVL